MNLPHQPCLGHSPVAERGERSQGRYRERRRAGVLIVEEDDDIAEIFMLVLDEEGYPVERAASPREALGLLAARGPHAFRVVLSAPFGHPFVAPYAWLDRLREHTSAAIVICSRFPARLYTTQWSASYAAFLEEPFDVHEMCALVAALYGGAEAPVTGSRRRSTELSANL